MAANDGEHPNGTHKILRGVVIVLLTVLMAIVGTWAVNMKHTMDNMDERQRDVVTRLHALELEVQRISKSIWPQSHVPSRP